MSTSVITILLFLGIISLFILGLSLRMLLVKNGEYRGGCASASPLLKNEIGNCDVCGATPDEQCKQDTKLSL